MVESGHRRVPDQIGCAYSAGEGAATSVTLPTTVLQRLVGQKFVRFFTSEEMVYSVFEEEEDMRFGMWDVRM